MNEINKNKANEREVDEKEVNENKAAFCGLLIMVTPIVAVLAFIFFAKSMGSFFELREMEILSIVEKIEDVYNFDKKEVGLLNIEEHGICFSYHHLEKDDIWFFIRNPKCQEKHNIDDFLRHRGYLTDEKRHIRGNITGTIYNLEKYINKNREGVYQISIFANNK